MHLGSLTMLPLQAAPRKMGADTVRQQERPRRSLKLRGFNSLRYADRAANAGRRFDDARAVNENGPRAKGPRSVGAADQIAHIPPLSQRRTTVRRFLPATFAIVAIVLGYAASAARGADDAPAAPAAKTDVKAYVQLEDVVFGELDGVGLLMDTFTPTEKANGLAIIDVASGAWFSDRGKINDHKRARMFDIFCGRGYTVFAVRPGSRNRFTALEMLDNLKLGIRWVKVHKDKYKIDPDRLGLTGASAGGHLASLCAVTADDGKPDDRNPLNRPSTRVKAVAVFFPPTDFTNWGKTRVDADNLGATSRMIGNLLYQGGITSQNKDEIFEQIKKISPALRATSSAPPFLIYHGDADPLVPLQQSELLIEALKRENVPAKLIVKPGGGHPWFTIHEEIAEVADWLDKELK
jgi:acetyl esterase/lipase